MAMSIEDPFELEAANNLDLLIHNWTRSGVVEAWWSVLQSRNPEATRLSPGYVRKGVSCKTNAKSFARSLSAVATSAEGSSQKNNI